MQICSKFGLVGYIEVSGKEATGFIELFSGMKKEIDKMQEKVDEYQLELEEKEISDLSLEVAEA